MVIEFLSMKEAQAYLGTSKMKMWRLVKNGVLPTYSDELDKRKKMVRKSDLDKFRQPQPRPKQ